MFYPLPEFDSGSGIMVMRKINKQRITQIKRILVKKPYIIFNYVVVVIIIKSQAGRLRYTDLQSN